MSKNFINLIDNDDFIKLRGYDLQELIVQVENFFLEYRTSLGLPKDLTFGVEIEYEGILKKKSDKFIKKEVPNWSSKLDGSLNSGGEIVSPIMVDELKYWEELKLVCEHLTERGADTQHNAGGHIHIGTCILGKDIDAWRNFLKLYTVYENVLFRFIYGDKISARKKLYRYAPPIADELYKFLEEINRAEEVIDLAHLFFSMRRYFALNFCNVKFNNPATKYERNTIEFRSPNATTSAIIWQNNINVFAKMLVVSRKKIMNEDFLDYKLREEYMTYSENRYLYDYINLKNVLEFVDLVFDNNLDKIYFLRQYLKDFEDGYGFKSAVKAKTFVKGSEIK